MGFVSRTGFIILMQRGHLFPWVPVCMGAGIGLYFQLSREPSVSVTIAIGAVSLVVAILAAKSGPIISVFLWGFALAGIGLCLAASRSHIVSAPTLSWRYYGPVEGTIVGLDRSATDATRITLSDVVLERVSSERTPERVRLSLHGPDGFSEPTPGMRVIVAAHLSPPAGPVEPGGFDFQRHAWFQTLGAVGYSRTPLLALAPPPDKDTVFATRMRLSKQIQNRMSGEVGGFAAAVTTGDRSGISQSTMQALRSSNLAHLLAISGLHMGLLAGFVFAAIRIGLALIPALALRLPVKKIAACVALVAAAVYLALSGGNVSTERAFIMAAVALFAVTIDRRALSMRAVAFAAVIVLTLRPESLLSPGFQMSFAATSALIAVFGALRTLEGWPVHPWMKPVLAVVLSSAIAGAATAPFAAAHFNQVSQFGLIANLLSVPLMGLVVIPSAVVAGVLTPFGLQDIALWVMGAGLRWILGVAHWISDLEGKGGAVPSPGEGVLALMSLGFIFLILWQGKTRAFGLIPVAVSLILWTQVSRPNVLIADSGGLVGVLTDQGRALSREKGQGFAAKNWLENDGDIATQKIAAERWDAQNPAGIRIAKVGDFSIIHVSGRKAAESFLDCAPSDIVIFSTPFEAELPCLSYDQTRLRETGSLAIYNIENQPQIITAREISGKRPWNSKPQN